jgi:mRNA-degrading endonuclease YafQ of YafQ-DinJ toxin-antitoxin module
MELRFTKSFDLDYIKLTKGNRILQKRIRKQFHRLRQQTNHPSLRLHKIQSSRYWSISIDKSIRVLLIFEKELIYIYHIGKHEDVY